MYYGIYKDIRNSAWRCLLDFQIDKLPIDVLKIARSAGIRVIKNSVVDELSLGEHGRAYFDGTNWYIIYDDRDPKELSRFTVAHELGHIFLGHALSYAKYSHMREVDKKPKSEQQADLFAIRLLCPACVIWGLDLHTPAEISDVCMVELGVARQRAKRISELYQRGRFLHSPLERQVYEMFEPFICEQKTRHKGSDI